LVRHVDLGPVDVEHLPQRDHRDPAPVAARDVDEHPRVVSAVVAHENPAQLGRALGETLDRRRLAHPAAPDDPARGKAPSGGEQRARGVSVVDQQPGDRARQPDRQPGEVEHRRTTQVRRHRPDEPRHGQDRSAIAEAHRAQRPHPAQLPAQRSQPEYAVDVEEQAVPLLVRVHGRSFPCRRSGVTRRALVSS
jgi:hypothetical protein